jgi:antitoxin (DNA-binding transcriptional repressor) of toxin-antitoxin stability system
MTDEHAVRIDVTRLPEELVALIDRLGPGEDLAITRNGDVIATISSAAGVELDGDPGRPAADFGDVTVVATAMKLSAAARASLSARLGPDYIVLDLHAAPTTADVLLVPPASPQLIGALRSLYPKARVVIAEIEDRELGISYRGPVRRMAEAGAETYLISSTISQLASQLDQVVTQRPQLGDGAGTRLEIEPGPDRQTSRTRS